MIIDDGSHSLKDMIFNLRFFFKYLANEGFFIIEDFNSPIYFEELNDANNSELFIHEILEKIKKKKILNLIFLIITTKMNCLTL